MSHTAPNTLSIDLDTLTTKQINKLTRWVNQPGTIIEKQGHTYTIKQKTHGDYYAFETIVWKTA